MKRWLCLVGLIVSLSGCHKIEEVEGVTAATSPVSEAVTHEYVDVKLERVSDGDTITVRERATDKKIIVRFYGIDAPEIKHNSKETGQPFGEEAKTALKNILNNCVISLDTLETDRYNRSVGMIYCNDKNVNLDMVQSGFAEAYTEYLNKQWKNVFVTAQADAQKAKRNIWSLANYERPSDYRRRNKK